MVVINSVLIASITHILHVFKFRNLFLTVLTIFIFVFCGVRLILLVEFLWFCLLLFIFCGGMGGLGIRKFSSFNQALLAKAAWRIVHNPQLLLSILFQAQYPSLGLQDPSPRVTRPSWGFQSLSLGFGVLG